MGALKGEAWRAGFDPATSKAWPIARWVTHDFVAGCPDIAAVDTRRGRGPPGRTYGWRAEQNRWSADGDPLHGITDALTHAIDKKEERVP
jgi:hypothetical protein